MVKRIVLLVLVVALGAARAAEAKGWDPPVFGARLVGTDVSDLFPGSTLSTPDRGVDASASAEVQRRMSKDVKLGLLAGADGVAWSRFSNASYAELSAGGWVRRVGTTVRVETAWTPSRLKFPADLEGGTFERLEARLGVRQSLGSALKLRVEARGQRDDFVTAFDARDAHTREGYAQLALRAGNRFAFRADGLLGRTAAASRKYSHADHAAGLGVTFTPARWRFDLAMTSGLSRYRDAIATDTNFRRRDQTLDVRAEVRRTLGAGLAAVAAAGFLDQSSSRIDRTYTTHTFQLGLSWDSTNN